MFKSFYERFLVCIGFVDSGTTAKRSDTPRRYNKVSICYTPYLDSIGTCTMWKYLDSVWKTVNFVFYVSSNVAVGGIMFPGF